jgi:hypothetical protein
MTFHSTKKILAGACAGFLAMSTLAGCGAKDDDTTTDPTTEASTPADDTPTTPTGDHIAADWASEIVTSDEVLFRGETDGVQLTIYKLAVHPAIKDSMFVDPDTKESVFTQGTDMVWVNYVWTNNTGETLLYSSTGGGLRYEDSPYMGKNPGVTDIEFRDSLGLPGTEYQPGAFNAAGSSWVHGTSFAVNDNIEYRPGVKVNLWNLKPSIKDSAGEWILDMYTFNGDEFTMV